MILTYAVYNWWLKRLDTQLNEPTNQFQPVELTNQKCYFKTLKISVMNIPIPSLSLGYTLIVLYKLTVSEH